MSWDKLHKSLYIKFTNIYKYNARYFIINYFLRFNILTHTNTNKHLSSNFVKKH